MNPNVSGPVNDAASRQEELSTKRSKLVAWMTERQLDGLLIGRHENIAWATAGLADVRVGLLRETGPATLLFLRDGSGYCLTTNNENDRLQAEEFAGLELAPVVNPWHANSLSESVRRITDSRRIAGDIAFENTAAISLYELREQLTEGEIARYRWLGRAAADAVEELLLRLTPGITEREMQACLGELLLRQGILPSVYLTAVDERLSRYPHPVPRDGRLRRSGMVGLCARRWGLVVSLTRFVHFGAVPEELSRSFMAVNHAAACLLSATREGITSDALFRVVQEEYANLGYAGAEQRHHQGGATGYVEREWFARPGGDEQVRPSQAFAWNPSLPGAKCEDTVLYHNGTLEVLTATPRLPQIFAEANSQRFSLADVLQR